MSLENEIGCLLKESDLTVAQPDQNNRDTYRVTFTDPNRGCTYINCPLAGAKLQAKWTGFCKNEGEALEKGARHIRGDCAYRQHRLLRE